MKDCQTTGVLIPIAFLSGGRGLASEYQIDLSKAEPKEPYVHATRSLSPNLRVATIAQYGRVCQRCQEPGDYGKGPDCKPWVVVRLDGQEPWISVNVTLSCQACSEEKGDILSSEASESGDDLDEKGDIDDEELPVVSQKGDTATSPQPLVTAIEPSDEPPVEPSSEDFPPGRGPDGIQDDGTFPEWFLPMQTLVGYKAREHKGFIEKIEGTCADPRVNATPALLVAAFVPFYRANRLEYGWSDPVAAMRKTLEKTIANVARWTPKAREDALKAVAASFSPVVGAEPSHVDLDAVAEGWKKDPELPCPRCADHGYYMVSEKPVLCGHKGPDRDQAFPMLPELNYAEVWVEVLILLESQLPRPSYETHFADTEFLGVDYDQAIIKCGSAHIVEMLNRRLYQAVYKALNITVGGNSSLEITFVWGDPVALVG